MRPNGVILLASAWFVACSVELAPAEQDPPAGAGTGGAETGGQGVGSGGSQEGGAGGIAGAFGGTAGIPGGAGGTGSVAAGGVGGLGGLGGGGTGSVSGGGGTGNGGGGFVCNLSAPECDIADPNGCVCAGCGYLSCDGVGEFFPDCVCDICWDDPICIINSCFLDGACDPFNEGCGCPDCELHPECIGF